MGAAVFKVLMERKKMKYEGSAKDRAEDKKGAKKAGMTQKQWESSPQDRKQDAAGTKRERKRKAKKKKALAT